MLPYYRNLGHQVGDLPAAESYYKTCLSLPMYPSLSDEEAQFVVDTVSEYT